MDITMNVEDAIADGLIHQIGMTKDGKPIYEGVLATYLRGEIIAAIQEEDTRGIRSD